MPIAALRNVFSLILAMTILQAASGLFGVIFPLSMKADGLTPLSVGLVGAAYSAGFMAGAWVGPTLLSRVGHIRVFAACSALAAAASLGVHWADGVIGWAVARAAMGGAIALMFAAVESWMNASIPKAERGSVIGIYMVATKASLAVGPFLTFGFAADASEPLMVAAALIMLAIVPVCFTTVAQPEPPKAQPLAIRDQTRVAPAAVTACFGAGVINAAVMTLAPLYAVHLYGEGSEKGFQAAAWIGSLLLQYPAGRWSDQVDRRIVIAALTGLAAVSAGVLAFFGGALRFELAALLFALWGAGALSFYGIAVAHMADRAEPGALARSTSGLLFVWAVGSVIGPLMAGACVDLWGEQALFWFAAVTCAVLTFAMIVRTGLRAAVVNRGKEIFAPKQATSVAAAEMAYGEGEEKR